MRSATGRLWTVLKATLGIGLLAALSLYSASVVDQRGLNPFAAALADAKVQENLGGAAPKKVIVVPGRLVNIVV